VLVPGPVLEFRGQRQLVVTGEARRQASAWHYFAALFLDRVLEIRLRVAKYARG
jgi:hypothetical protein